MEFVGDHYLPGSCGIIATGRRTLLLRCSLRRLFLRGPANLERLAQKHYCAPSHLISYCLSDRLLLEGAEMHDDVRKQGAHAARQGLTLWDCPYLKAEAMPGHTGENPADWQAKIDAWEAGWHGELKRRRSPLKALISPMNAGHR
ncbi:CrpP-related protein [Achromobacter denitrificans]|uniref:CrpP-related protein n=2 Tax=Achromobacter denitrificans TaxID=32002 RepID=UPI003D074BD5